MGRTDPAAADTTTDEPLDVGETDRPAIRVPADRHAAAVPMERRPTQSTVEIMTMALRECIARVGATHHAAWWPGTGAIGHSRIGANKTRDSGPVLTPGDQASNDRYGEFVADLRALFRDVAKLTGTTHQTHTTLRRDTHPAVVVDTLRGIVAMLARTPWQVLSRDGDTLKAASARVQRLRRHQDAILSRPRVRPGVPCLNAGGRDLCTGWATNQRRQLCRSCENHEQYVKTRTRRRR